MTAMVQKRGRVLANQGGKDFDWRVKILRTPLLPYSDFDLLAYERIDRARVATLDWRSYIAMDAISWYERQLSKGMEAIIKTYEEMTKNVQEDAEEQFALEWFVDGNATGNQRRIHGLESIFSVSGLSGAGFVGVPNDNYAGLSTGLGALGGDWNTVDAGGNNNWPDGAGDYQFDAWSPVVIDYRSLVWGGATNEWADNGSTCMRYGNLVAQRNNNAGDGLDFWLLERSMYQDFLQQLDDKERILVERDKKSSLLVSMGFNATYFDGVEVTWEWGLPYSSNTVDNRVGYGINIDKIEYLSALSGIFAARGPEVDPSRDAEVIKVAAIGNVKFASPRHQQKLVAITV